MNEFSAGDLELLVRLAQRPPLLDVRAPIEFAKGSIPGATNLPLLEDDERAAVGKAFKKHGQDEAIRLGHSILSGETRAQRIQAWADFVQSHPDALLYCFRGGLRSRSVQNALREEGIAIPLIEGGYKRARQLFIQVTELAATSASFGVVTGYTGSGKTELLRTLNRGVCDLEGLANHKGSAFGTDVNSPQPAQADFENRLGLRLFELMHERSPQIFVEDESRMIGYSVIPVKLFARISNAPVYLVERSRAERAEFLTRTYIADNFGLREGDKDPERIAGLKKQILTSLTLIQRRLGGAESKIFGILVETAIGEHLATGSFAAHYEWVDRLLEKYYDPMYAHHLEKIRDRIVFTGGWAEVQDKLLHST